ncbi:sensor histidine kinase [Brachybacterium hainanense]|uniref:histidine kinase n=1 Tax=Brachybacterium hainanense TaxID=1541174 RepID=A0ABV6RD12_9MICO
MSRSAADALADPGVRSRPDRIERRDVRAALLYIGAVLALQLVGVGTSGFLGGSSEQTHVLGLVVLLVAAVGTLWRRRHPVVTLAVTGGLSVGIVLWGGQIAAYLLLFEALWSPIVHGTLRLARAATAVAAVLSASLIAALVQLLGPGEGMVVGLLVVVVAVATPLAWGWDVRLHRTAQLTAEALAAAERTLAAERADRAVELERKEIAQDLHDLVAGHLSAVTLHAGLARSLPDAAAREQSLLTTQDSARAALRDLRAMIGLLTEEDANTARVLGTTVSWAELENRLRTGDAAADISVDPLVEDETTVGPAVRAALLRCGAEAVTNALRHGQAPRTLQVRLERDRREVILTCTNRISGAADPGTGLGLDSLQHRCRALGGVARSATDPRDPGSWRLEVRLPARIDAVPAPPAHDPPTPAPPPRGGPA